MYQSAVTVRLLARGKVATWPSETDNHFLLCSAWSSEFSGWGLVLEQPGCWLLLGFQIILIDPSLITCQYFPVSFEWPPLNFRNMHLHHSVLTCRLSVNKWWIPLAHRLLMQRWSYIMDMVACILMLRLSWISWMVILGLSLINFSGASMFVTITALTGVPRWCSSSKLNLSHLNSPNQKKTWAFDRAFLPNSCFKFSKEFSWCTPFT